MAEQEERLGGDCISSGVWKSLVPRDGPVCRSHEDHGVMQNEDENRILSIHPNISETYARDTCRSKDFTISLCLLHINCCICVRWKCMDIEVGHLVHCCFGLSLLSGQRERMLLK